MVEIINEEKYLKETNKWDINKWKQEMNINKVKVGDIIEGLWYPEGYFNGVVELIEGKKGIKTSNDTIAHLKYSYSFRVVK
jgi:hypothetical protein